nr:GrpB family protein [Desnuesiella massiliensis]
MDTHYIHVVIYGNTEWNNNIKFRDILNENEDIMKEYEDLKMQLANEYPKDRVTYTSMKAGFIQRIMSGYKQNYVSFDLQPSHIEYNLFCYK